MTTLSFHQMERSINHKLLMSQFKTRNRLERHQQSQKKLLVNPMSHYQNNNEMRNHNAYYMYKAYTL